MNCAQTSELLSFYFDGEVAEGEGTRHDEIREHVASCESCAKELLAFEQLRKLASSETQTQLAPPSWDSIALRLDDVGHINLAAISDPAYGLATDTQQSSVSKPSLSRNRRVAMGGLLTLAASVLLFFSLRENNSAHVVQATMATIDLKPLIQSFKSDSQKALATLVSQYPTTDVSMAKAEADFGRPTFVHTSATSNSLPGNAHLVSTKLMQFPSCSCRKGACTCGPGGCSCVACLCERPDGSSYLVLELCKSRSINFGDLPVQIVKYGTHHLQQVEADGTLAISWEQNNERLTAIGLRGPQEINSLFAKN